MLKQKQTWHHFLFTTWTDFLLFSETFECHGVATQPLKSEQNREEQLIFTSEPETEVCHTTPCTLAARHVPALRHHDVQCFLTCDETQRCLILWNCLKTKYKHFTEMSCRSLPGRCFPPRSVCVCVWLCVELCCSREKISAPARALGFTSGTNSWPTSGPQSHSLSFTKDSRLICSGFTSASWLPLTKKQRRCTCMFVSLALTSQQLCT